MKVVHRHIETGSKEDHHQMLLGIHRRCVELLRNRETHSPLQNPLNCDVRGR